eukprot:SAG31_NODE_5726_length_2358_cov_1.433820_1_plen_61_part_00
MEENMRAMAVKRPVRGSTEAMSLIDVGYDRAGLDDAWQVRLWFWLHQLSTDLRYVSICAW